MVNKKKKSNVIQSNTTDSVGFDFGAGVPISNNVDNYPTYEEKGVKYKGYSKTLTSPNNYAITRQEPFLIVGFTVGGATEEDIYTVPKNKTLYVNSAIVSFQIMGEATNVYYITDGDSNAIPPERIKFYVRPKDQEPIFIMYFNPPLEFKNAIRVGQILSSSDSSYYGWLE